jgi:SAM-dependent MidA family methyltransferase
MALRDRLVSQIIQSGPISVAAYMDACLNDPLEGYYATRPNLGDAGDFITAPMVSQMFGELLGLWAATVWTRLGCPACVRLVEMGPGHGFMITDVLRAARASPGFLDAIELWLVETSAPLRGCQSETLAGLASPHWAATLDETPEDAPIILLANEVLDCLPIHQAVFGRDGWRERRVGLGQDRSLSFVAGGALTPPNLGQALTTNARPGAVAEWSPMLAELGRKVGTKVTRSRGAALFIDYGHSTPGLGDTLQAVRNHCKEDPLAHPGAADLTAHVDFQVFLAAAGSSGAWTGPIRSQGQFLTGLGIDARAQTLAASNPCKAGLITRQLERLTGAGQMGSLFKCAAVGSPDLSLPGFDDQP